MFDREILPGGEGRLEVVIHGAALRPGKARARIELYCNDPRAPFLVLKGTVAPPLQSAALHADRARAR